MREIIYRRKNVASRKKFENMLKCERNIQKGLNEQTARGRQRKSSTLLTQKPLKLIYSLRSNKYLCDIDLIAMRISSYTSISFSLADGSCFRSNYMSFSVIWTWINWIGIKINFVCSSRRNHIKEMFMWNEEIMCSFALTFAP